MPPKDHPIRNLAPGLYERLIDEQLLADLLPLRDRFHVQEGAVDAGESHAVLAQHLGQLAQQVLAEFSGPERLIRQVALCNRLIALLRDARPGRDESPSALVEEARRLLAISERRPLLKSAVPERPSTPLATSALLTGTKVDPSLVSQLRREMGTADRVDILCSFIKWSGIRVLQDELEQIAQRDGSRIRIITTSYMGATEPKAVEFLSRLPNTELKISYDTRRTRLHAKAYLFHRDTCFGTAYVGSSNLSNAALTDGLEWNVKISQYESPHLWEKLRATFDSYWEEAEFVAYSEADRERLNLAIQEERGEYDAAPRFQADIRPYPYQEEILDRLQAERKLHGRQRSLVVAATGTGKTVIAAFDFRRICEAYQQQNPGRLPRLLFIAHRDEILKQSRDCFRAILRDWNFGDLIVGTHRPARLEHLFVAIQSYNSKRLSEQFEPDYFDYIVVDEFHHAEAPSYQRLLDHVRPRLLLGLTATPERADGLNVLRHFGDHISAEIRLPEAINRKLLCPFQYFGITDSVDLSVLTWRRGGYDAEELNASYTGNDARADLVVRSVQEKLENVARARALGFCVSVAHAEYMAAYFQKRGLPTAALSGNSSAQDRRTVQKRLVDGEINFLFVVDLYNEGVDIPEVDTVLLLRPTESLTVFLQQLGRGLRLCRGKDCLTVLDFIGQSHRSYNWELRFRALMDRPRKRIDQEIEDGCLHLPLGCFLHLERVAQQHVLENVRKALQQGAHDLVRRIRSFTEDTGQELTFARFLDHYGWEPEAIYRRSSWSRLCARAGVRPPFTEPDELIITKGLRRIQHINSPELIRRLQRLIADVVPTMVGTPECSGSDMGSSRRTRSEAKTPASLDLLDERALLMLHVAFWKKWRPCFPAENLARLSQSPVLRAELLELLAYQFERLEEVPAALELPFPCALELHGAYTRDEILVGLGEWTLDRQREVREGVLYIEELNTDVFFVTLNKTETDYSPTTLYEDYAISADRFHWQSQSTTSETSKTGQRYIHHAERSGTVLLFAREDKEQNDLACPYHFLGPVLYESHSGSKPLSIVWRLLHPIPARLQAAAIRLGAA